MGYAVITSTSAYLAACAEATQPLIRTVLFFSATVAMRDSALSAPVLYILGWTIGKVLQLLRLPPVQSLRDGKRRIHPHDTGIEVELGHALEATSWTLLDADTAALAVINQNLVETVRTDRSRNTRLRTHEIAVVAGVAGATAEAAIGLLDRLLLRERLNDFLLRATPVNRFQH